MQEYMKVCSGSWQSISGKVPEQAVGAAARMMPAEQNERSQGMHGASRSWIREDIKEEWTWIVGKAEEKDVLKEYGALGHPSAHSEGETECIDVHTRDRMIKILMMQVQSKKSEEDK